MNTKAQQLPKSELANTAETKILIVAPQIPKPDVAAGDVRFFAMLQILTKNNSVDFYMTQENHDAPEVLHYKQGLQKIGVNVLSKETLGLEMAALRRFYDIVIFEFWHCADECMGIIRRQQPWAKIVIDSVDMHFLREEAGLALGISEASVVQVNKQREIKTYQQADLVVVVTAEDREALVLEKVTKPLHLVPMIVPISMRKAKERAQELLFIGGFRHAPNADGLLWFVNECWPLVRARFPVATLTVVGSHPPQEILDLGNQEGIHVVGFVPETAPYLDKACLSIAPLRFGAGMKGKVTEAMAAGVPVVTTKFGAQGLNAVPGKHLMVGDGPSVFAEQIIGLLSDPDQMKSLGAAGQEHIIQLCSAEVVEKQLNEVVSSLMRTPSKQSFVSVLTSLRYRSVIAGKFAVFCVKKPVKKLVKKFYSPNRVSNQAA